MPQRTAVQLDLDNWKKPLAFGIWSSLLVLLILVAWRKSTGIFDETVTTMGASSVSGLAMFLSLVASVLYQSSGLDQSSRKKKFLAGIVTLVPPMLLGIAMLPGHSATADASFVTIFLVASIIMLFSPDFIYLLELSRTEEAPKEPTQLLISNSTSELEREQFYATSVKTATEISSNETEIETGEIPEQWTTRQVNEDGCDCLDGSLQIHFSAGQKVATLHIPFSPPFETTPELTCEVLEDSSIRQKVAAIYTFGARIEARRSDDVETELIVNLGFQAVESESSTEAA